MSDVGRPLALNVALSPLFTDRWLSLATARLDRAAAAARRPPEPAVFPRGTGPVRVGGVTAAQPDGVTCAATGLLLLNAAYDPALAGWLERGEPPAGTTPPEIAALGAAERESPRTADRLRLAAAEVHRRATRRALGPFPWPRRYGTPPWGVARDARVPGVRYAHRAVDDRDGAVMDRVVDLVVRATTAGFPVPLYSGGDLSGGWQAAVPRHLVLALPTTDPDGLRVYEPGSGRVRTIAPGELRARTAPHPALGGWPHLAWVLIPVVR